MMLQQESRKCLRAMKKVSKAGINVFLWRAKGRCGVICTAKRCSGDIPVANGDGCKEERMSEQNVCGEGRARVEVNVE
jgi:hypothetical protein